MIFKKIGDAFLPRGGTSAPEVAIGAPQGPQNCKTIPGFPELQKMHCGGSVQGTLTWNIYGRGRLYFGRKCDLHSADFNLLRIINLDPRALLAPQAPKRFFSMVPGTFQKLWGNDFQKVSKKCVFRNNYFPGIPRIFMGICMGFEENHRVYGTGKVSARCINT